MQATGESMSASLVHVRVFATSAKTLIRDGPRPWAIDLAAYCQLSHAARAYPPASPWSKTLDSPRMQGPDRSDQGANQLVPEPRQTV